MALHFLSRLILKARAHWPVQSASINTQRSALSHRSTLHKDCSVPCYTYPEALLHNGLFTQCTYLGPRTATQTQICAQSANYHTIDCLEERGVERGSARRSSLKGCERAIVNQTNTGTVSKATSGKPLRDGAERMWAFPSV